MRERFKDWRNAIDFEVHLKLLSLYDEEPNDDEEHGDEMIHVHPRSRFFLCVCDSSQI